MVDIAIHSGKCQFSSYIGLRRPGATYALVLFVFVIKTNIVVHSMCMIDIVILSVDSQVILSEGQQG